MPAPLLRLGLSWALIPVAMAGVEEGPLAGSWGAGLFPCVRAKVQEAWAARPIPF